MIEKYSQLERKLVYRLLHASLIHHPELMDSALLEDLQGGLQLEAQREGVDVTDHGAWDRWLGNEAIPCDVRMAGRRVL